MGAFLETALPADRLMHRLQQMWRAPVNGFAGSVGVTLSADPLLRTRQDAAAAIRHLLTRFHVINPLDQRKP